MCTLAFHVLFYHVCVILFLRFSLVVRIQEFSLVQCLLVWEGSVSIILLLGYGFYFYTRN